MSERDARSFCASNFCATSCVCCLVCLDVARAFQRLCPGTLDLAVYVGLV